MADFLTRLVERAWGQTPTAQPLIAPRYAIKPSHFDAPFFDPLAPSEPSETPRAGLLPALRSPVTSPQPPAVGLPVAPNPSPVIEANPETKPVLTPSAELTAAWRPPHRQASLAPVQVQSPNEPALRPRLRSHQVDAAPEIGSTPRRIESVLTQPFSADHAASQLPGRAAIQQNTPDRAARDSTLAAASRPLVTQVETPETPIFSAWAAPLSPVAPSPLNQLVRLKSEPSAPTIKVTIGRIEVRAVFEPPAQTTSPAKPEPKISLEDYLRASTSNGGQR